MVFISCFYVHYNRNEVNFTFVRFEKFIKVILNDRSVILTNEQFVSNNKLFQIYILSLLCTEDSSTIQMEQINIKRDRTVNSYGVLTKINWKLMYFTNDYRFIPLKKLFINNPLNMEEPKRATSMKKVRKFLKLLNGNIADLMDEPDKIINDFYRHESEEVIDYLESYISYNVQTIALHSIIQKYGSDVLTSVSKFLWDDFSKKWQNIVFCHYK